MKEVDRALLRALFSTGPDALASLHASRAALDLDRVPPGHHLLLPWLSARLEALGLAQDARLAGVRRRAWYADQLAWRTLDAATAILHAADVTPALYGDAASARTMGPLGPLRPVETPALLVPASRARRAVSTLIDHGWRPLPATAAVRSPELYVWRAACLLESPGNLRLTVQWQALGDWPAPRLTAAIWSQTEPDPGSDLRLTLSATAQLLLAAAGPRKTPRALADVITLSRSAGPLDWPWLIETAESAGVAARLLGALAAAREVVEVRVPDVVVARLRVSAARSRHPDGLANEAATGLGLHLQRFRRAAEAQAVRPSPSAWLEYLQHQWGLAHRGDVVRRVLRRVSLWNGPCDDPAREGSDDPGSRGRGGRLDR